MPVIIADRVKETSVTSGAGALTLDAAVSGFRRFSAVCSVGDQVHYAAVSRTLAEWEVGVGTYSAANTLTRSTVLASSNGNAAVNFSGSTLDVWINFGAQQAGWLRERLTADRSYYVSATGSDSNSGLTVGAPFLTINKALSVIAGLDCGWREVTINIGQGTFAEAINIGETHKFTNLKYLLIFGDPEVWPVLSEPIVNEWAGPKLYLGHIQTPHIEASQGGIIEFADIEFITEVNAHITARSGGRIIGNDHTISGGAAHHILVGADGYYESQSVTFTLTGTPAFSTAFVEVAEGGVAVLKSNTYSGAATGVRYKATMNGVIARAGATLPGSVAGTTATGGQSA